VDTIRGGGLGPDPRRLAAGCVVAPTEIAHAVVALYLGLELLSHLDGDRQPALALFERARQLAMLADLVTGSKASAARPSKETLEEEA